MYSDLWTFENIWGSMRTVTAMHQLTNLFCYLWDLLLIEQIDRSDEMCHQLIKGCVSCNQQPRANQYTCEWKHRQITVCMDVIVYSFKIKTSKLMSLGSDRYQEEVRMVTSQSRWNDTRDYELGSVATDDPRRSGDWQTVDHVCVASQNRHLITSSIAAHYIDHHPKPVSSKLGHWPEHGSNNWVDNVILIRWYTKEEDDMAFSWTHRVWRQRLRLSCDFLRRSRSVAARQPWSYARC